MGSSSWHGQEVGAVVIRAPADSARHVRTTTLPPAPPPPPPPQRAHCPTRIPVESSPAGEPMDPVAWLLLVLVTPAPMWGSVRLEQRAAGGSILLSCDLSGPPLRWVWSPQFPDCAGLAGDLLHLARLPPSPEPPPGRFQGRLHALPAPPGTLLLQNLRMSDSGTFTCLGATGAQRPVHLQVSGGEADPPRPPAGGPPRLPPSLTPLLPPGCQNNLTVFSNQTSPRSLTLHCQHCPPWARLGPFRWLLQAQPLGNRPWAAKSDHGATLQLDPAQRAAWGRWECLPRLGPSLGFEFCLAPPLGAGDTGPSAEWGIWVAVAAAVLLGAGLGAWCLRWQRRPPVLSCMPPSSSPGHLVSPQRAPPAPRPTPPWPDPPAWESRWGAGHALARGVPPVNTAQH
ncbi:megakaryocyte and platelet inhibitory receptor G6b isoform X2 [Carettochelys insculpta]|uniref:megakaryocyte and platelet inhibitory receptor G6b isoform X2 n=1 Tax=Carettochelys insculpta TaxID=44489 RepID=UPI003EBE0D05